MGHQNRAAFIPAFLQRVVAAEQQLFAAQCAGDALVQAFYPPRAFAQRAQQLEVAVGAEHLAGPGVIYGWVLFEGFPPWALGVQHVEVVAVAGGWGDGLAVMVAAAFAVIQKTARAAVNH